MKCQKCGKNEVNFHYSTNVNGCVTETNLCSGCAAESGYDVGQMFNLGSGYSNDRHNSLGQASADGNQIAHDQMLDITDIIESVFSASGGLSGFMPMAIPVMRSNTMFPFTIRPRVRVIGPGNTYECGCEKHKRGELSVEVDAEMSMRRELNAQMHIAVKNEEFEKAAVLRDKIRELETGRNSKCDSETNSQDSQAAQ